VLNVDENHLSVLTIELKHTRLHTMDRDPSEYTSGSRWGSLWRSHVTSDRLEDRKDERCLSGTGPCIARTPAISVARHTHGPAPTPPSHPAMADALPKRSAPFTAASNHMLNSRESALARIRQRNTYWTPAPTLRKGQSTLTSARSSPNQTASVPSTADQKLEQIKVQMAIQAQQRAISLLQEILQEMLELQEQLKDKRDKQKYNPRYQQPIGKPSYQYLQEEEQDRRRCIDKFEELFGAGSRGERSKTTKAPQVDKSTHFRAAPPKRTSEPLPHPVLDLIAPEPETLVEAMSQQHMSKIVENKRPAGIRLKGTEGEAFPEDFEPLDLDSDGEQGWENAKDGFDEWEMLDN